MSNSLAEINWNSVGRKFQEIVSRHLVPAIWGYKENRQGGAEYQLDNLKEYIKTKTVT